MSPKHVSYLLAAVFFVFGVNQVLAEDRPTNMNTVLSNIICKAVACAGTEDAFRESGKGNPFQYKIPENKNSEEGIAEGFMVDAKGERKFRYECGSQGDNCKFKLNRIVEGKDLSNLKFERIELHDSQTKLGPFATWVQKGQIAAAKPKVVTNKVSSGKGKSLKAVPGPWTVTITSADGEALSALKAASKNK